MRLALCKWLALVSFVLFIGLTQFTNPAVAATNSPTPALVDHAAQSITEDVKKSAEPGLHGQHPKSHGLVWAEFTVEPNLPEDLKVGVFKQPGRTFPAWIRFSNARGKDDTKNGLHGMAIKLMDVEGEKVLPDEKDAKTQDFILVDHPVFFLRNAQDSANFFNALAESDGQPPLKQFFFAGVNPLKWHPREFRILLAMQNKKIESPLLTQYWSGTPYQLGASAIKFSANPTGSQPELSISKTENYLHTAMVEQLKTQDASFDFLVQRQTDPAKMPIDDATVEWSEKESPFQKVATIKIPRQVFDSSEQETFGENLSFNPWHSLPEHAPLGSVNQARKTIYQSLSEQRHQFRKVAVQEPTVQSFTPNLVSSGDRPA
jgi:hypothetical protein